MEHAVLLASAVSLALLATFTGLLRRRLVRVERSERAAIERRDRFLGACAGELKAPLVALRSQVEQAGDRALAERFEELAGLVSELADLPRRREEMVLAEVDLAEIVREVLVAPPFSTSGPSVILRATKVVLAADRPRLLGGIRLLLLALRHETTPDGCLTVTVSGDGERALLEVDTPGAPGTREAVERDAVFDYGLSAPAVVAPPGATLAVRVAAQVARVHGGHISAAARAGGERFVLELPTARPA